MRVGGSKKAGRCAGENAFSGRQLCEDFAPRNEGIRICGQGGAKRPVGVRAKMHLTAGNCVKILLPETRA